MVGWRGARSRYGHLAVLPSLSVSHVNVFFPVSTKPPLSLVCLVSVFVAFSFSINVCLCVCLSVFLCVFSPSPSSLPSFLPSFPYFPPASSSSVSFCLLLSLTLAVSTFGETPQEHHPVKFFHCPPPPLHPRPSLSTTGSKWLLALSFFVLLIICAHSRRIVLIVLLFTCHKKNHLNSATMSSIRLKSLNFFYNLYL